MKGSSARMESVDKAGLSILPYITPVHWELTLTVCCAASKFDHLKYVSLRSIEGTSFFFNGQNQDRQIFARNTFLTLMWLLYPFQIKFLILLHGVCIATESFAK